MHGEEVNHVHYFMGSYELLCATAPSREEVDFEIREKKKIACHSYHLWRVTDVLIRTVGRGRGGGASGWMSSGCCRVKRFDWSVVVR